MIKLFKLFIPGSLAFLYITLIVGVVLLFKRTTNRIGKYCIAIVIVLYLIFSIPITARWFAVPLGWGFHSLENRDTAHGAKAIVVLDAGTTRFRDQKNRVEIPLNTTVLRALEAIRIYQLLDHPLVIVSGGNNQLEPGWEPDASVLRYQLINGGVPLDRIILDSKSFNTHDHVVNIGLILKSRGINSFVLVTSPDHMRRAMWAFQSVGINPVASPCKGMMDKYSGWMAWFPSTNTLEFTQATMHEYFGIIYYFLRGYI